MTVTAIIAIAIARGTVRDGSRTSPLGTSALSMPRYAKISTTDVRVTVPIAGAGPNAKFSRRTASAPTTITSTSGSTFATVITPLTAAPCRTPTTFTQPSDRSTARNTSACAVAGASAGTSAPIASVSSVPTAAIANVPASHSSTPARKPTNGPNATSTYAYGPPVSDTRLPASAKQSTTSTMASVHARYASGAAPPSDAATVAGSRKMLPPMVTFTMLAARTQGPNARTRERSAAGGPGSMAPNVAVRAGDRRGGAVLSL